MPPVDRILMLTRLGHIERVMGYAWETFFLCTGKKIFAGFWMVQVRSKIVRLWPRDPPKRIFHVLLPLGPFWRCSRPENELIGPEISSRFFCPYRKKRSRVQIFVEPAPDACPHSVVVVGHSRRFLPTQNGTIRMGVPSSAS